MLPLDLTEQFRDSDLTNAEVYSFGVALLDFMSATMHLGHDSPASTLDYTVGIEHAGNVFTLVARDFVAWTAGRMDLVPEGCEDRIRAWAGSVAKAWLNEPVERGAA